VRDGRRVRDPERRRYHRGVKRLLAATVALVALLTLVSACVSESDERTVSESPESAAELPVKAEVIVEGEGIFACEATAWVSTTKEGEVREVRVDSQADLRGDTVYNADPAESAPPWQPDGVQKPADPARNTSAEYAGPVHLDASGQLVAGWAVCTPIEQYPPGSDRYP
jgi:hypothetical protein